MEKKLSRRKGKKITGQKKKETGEKKMKERKKDSKRRGCDDRAIHSAGKRGTNRIEWRNKKTEGNFKKCKGRLGHRGHRA